MEAACLIARCRTSIFEWSVSDISETLQTFVIHVMVMKASL